MPEMWEIVLEDYLERLGELFPLTEKDRELIKAASDTATEAYQPGFHHLAAAGLGYSRRTFTGVHMDVKIGQGSICAETSVLLQAERAGDGLLTLVAVHRGHPNEGSKPRVVSPCGMCRERLMQFAPRVMVIVPFDGWIIKVPIEALLPLAYAQRYRSGPPVRIPTSEPEQAAPADFAHAAPVHPNPRQ